MEMIDSKNYIIHASFVGDGDLLRPASILDLFQDEASIHADKLHLGFDDMVKKDLLWIVNYQEIDIVGKLPKYCDEVIVSTWPHERKRLDYIREYDITDLEGNLLVSGIASWFTINKNTRRLVKDDSVDFGNEYFNHTNYPEFKRKKLNLIPASEVTTWDYQVTYTDLDHNGHMNNAKYLDVIYNFHKGFSLDKIAKICISFEHEIKLGEIINLEYFKNEQNESCYIGKVNGVECFLVSIKERND